MGQGGDDLEGLRQLAGLVSGEDKADSATRVSSAIDSGAGELLLGVDLDNLGGQLDGVFGSASTDDLGSCRLSGFVLGNLFQLTYNAADSVIVGKFVGDEALAAVGTAGPVMNMIILFISGMCMTFLER